MFEKEAEEYVIKKHHIDKTKLSIDFSLRCEFSDDFTDFQKGAEFGYNKCNTELTKAKEIIKDYLTIVKGSHTTVCSVPEENRTIYVLKLNEEAEQFLNGEVYL